jgi:hypothetical protein
LSARRGACVKNVLVTERDFGELENGEGLEPVWIIVSYPEQFRVRIEGKHDVHPMNRHSLGSIKNNRIPCPTSILRPNWKEQPLTPTKLDYR